MRTEPANYPILRDAFIASGIATCSPPMGMSLIAENLIPKPNIQSLDVLQYAGAGGDILFRIETTSEHVELFLYTLTGQEVNHWSLTGGHTELLQIDAGSLPFGMYFLTARCGLEQQTVKFIR